MYRPEIQTAASADHGGGREFAGAGRLTDRHAKEWEQWRARVQCAGCAQPISLIVPMAVCGAEAFHPSCARRFDERGRAQRTATAAAPQIIGTIVRVAVPYNVSGLMRRRSADGEVWYGHERIDRDAFRASIAAGGQELRIQHGPGAVPGVLTLYDEPDALLFRFVVHESPLGRRAYDAVKRGELRACSVGLRYGRHDVRFDRYKVEVITRATLEEISITGSPAWYGTSARIES